MISVLDALRAMGGDAILSEVYDWLRKQDRVWRNDLEIIQNDRGTRFDKQVRFARQELFWADLITGETKGRWRLSEAGVTTLLTPEGARAIINQRRRGKFIKGDSRPSANGEPYVGPTTGPVPVSWSGVVTRESQRLSWTYVMRFADSDIWKVGHASDVSTRLKEINKHIPIELMTDCWKNIYRQPWASAEIAHEREQELLRLLSSHRTYGERVRCEQRLINDAWRAVSERSSI